MQSLYLSNNYLTGAIPDFSALPHLEELSLSSNQLTGAIPDFSALPNLESFSFYGNQLTLMDTNCNAVTQISQVECESLLELYHSTNGAEWKNNEGWNVTNTPCSWHGVTCENGGVTEISLRYSNNLNGTLPDFRGLPNLQRLLLDNNQLTGAIPDFSALPHLERLFLSNNQLTGAIPDFSALPNLQGLSLINNQLTGAIPDFSALPQLEVLSLWENQLTGAIPDFSALPQLEYLDLESNQLTGTIPDFSTLSNLYKLYLSDNQLTGAIPDFSALTKLEFLDLRSNPICKGNINYAILPIKQAKGNDTTSWQEELDGFPNCPVSPAATVEMQLNKSRYTTNNPLRLELQVNGQAMADLYVAIVFPEEGGFMTIAYPLSFSELNAIQIYQPAVEIAGQKTYSIMDFPLPVGIPTGGYHACGVLVLAGKHHSEDNWIDKHCVGFEVY